MANELQIPSRTRGPAGDRSVEGSGTLPLSNSAVAVLLEEVADLLEAQNANAFRVRAYRNAAETLRTLKQPVSELSAGDDVSELVQLPGIGKSLARSIEQLCHTGRLPLLEQLRGEGAVERIFATVPGIGREMAARIHETLGIETLAELETAALDGSLAQVPGMGRKRLRAVRESLAGRFRYRARVATAQRQPAEQPPVAELLNVDQEYRRKAELDRLPRIAPRRFNPTGAAWLPILHTQRGDRHYTALFSNTARAHEFGTVFDWVVIYRDDQRGDVQWTVITSRFGKLKGRRIVRGLETDCMAYYAELSSAEEA